MDLFRGFYALKKDAIDHGNFIKQIIIYGYG